MDSTPEHVRRSATFPLAEQTGPLRARPSLRFVCVRDETRASVTALCDLIAVGSLRWLIDEDEGAETGMIMHVEVHPAWRRQGVATALLGVAEAYAKAYAWPTPTHCPERSEDGDAWARAMGADPAEKVHRPAEADGTTPCR